MKRLLALVLVLACVGVWSAWPHSGSVGESAPQAIVGSFRLTVPPSWVRSSSHGISVWRSPGGHSRVMVALLGAGPRALTSVVRDSQHAIAQAVQGYRGEVRDVSFADGGSGVLHRFQVRDRGRSVAMLQVWRRSPNGRQDLVATWSAQAPERVNERLALALRLLEDGG